jgi:hypothetical protein
MHSEIMEFLGRAYRESGASAGRSVVEFGSYNVNGSARDVFGVLPHYVGVDWRPGPSVDVVSLAHDYQRATNVPPHDVGLSCQCLEHDPYWQDTLRTLFRMVTNDHAGAAWLVVTCAGPGYPVHDLETAPLVDGQPYYRNVSTDEIVAVLRAAADAAGRTVTIHQEYQRGTLDALVWVQVGSRPTPKKRATR